LIVLLLLVVPVVAIGLLVIVEFVTRLRLLSAKLARSRQVERADRSAAAAARKEDKKDPEELLLSC